MSHLLRRRRGHDSEDDDDEGSVITDIDENEELTTTDCDNSEVEASDYDSDEDSHLEPDEEPDDETQDDVKEDDNENQDKNNTALSENFEPPVTSEAAAATEIDYEELQQQEKEKTVHELREYRRKLAEDPSFVPYVGLFWGHDDRYREDSLAETRESAPHFSTANASVKKQTYDRNLDPLMHKKWDHSGYEELLRLDEEDERRKRDMVESGQSQIDERPHRPSRYNNNNNGRGGRGRGRGGGHFHQQQNRNMHSQKRPNEEWPQLSNVNANKSEDLGKTVEESFSDTVEKQTVGAWGSIDRAEEIEPIVKNEMAAEGWGASFTSKSLDGWAISPNTASKEAESKTHISDDAKTISGNIIDELPLKNSGNGWGAAPKVDSNNGWKSVAVESHSNLAPNLDVQVSSSVQQSTHVGVSNTKEPAVDGWGSTPVSTEVSSNNWGNVEPMNDNERTATDNTKLEELPTTNQGLSAPLPDEPANEGWGNVQETTTTDSWATNEANDWKKPQTSKNSQWDATTSNNNHDARKNKLWIKSTAQRDQEIPSTEKASSSWANVKPDVEVHTTPSDFSKIVYNKTDRSGPSRRNNNHHQQGDNWKSRSTFDSKQKPRQDDLAETQAFDTNVTNDNGWNSAENNTDPIQDDGWGTTSATPKNQDIDNVENSWNTEPASETLKANSSWNVPESSSKAKSSNWNDSSAGFDQSNSSSSSSVRGGWSNSRSNNSTNWNTDREWNNKARNNERQQAQPKKSRGYFSSKMEATVFEPNSTPEESNTPETSAWGNFQSTGDDDSDVEIILEAEEEPEWLKDEQVLGMTSPGKQDQPTYSPRAAMTKPYLQHDSGQSSPRPEYNRNANGRNSKPRRNFDDNWRQQREEPEAFRPMYYPAPGPPPNQMNGNITYVPMIPTGNGSPMYAMPFSMGSSPSGRSVSPLHHGEASKASPPPNHQPPKFYTPSPPNLQQLPPGYEANGMVYYGMDPSAMYPPPQPFYYYAPPMMPNGEPYNNDTVRHSSLSPQHARVEDEEGWGPTPETVETEEQWATKPTQNDFQNRKQPVNNYYYPQQHHHY